MPTFEEGQPHLETADTVPFLGLPPTEVGLIDSEVPWVVLEAEKVLQIYFESLVHLEIDLDMAAAAKMEFGTCTVGQMCLVTAEAVWVVFGTVGLPQMDPVSTEPAQIAEEAGELPQTFLETDKVQQMDSVPTVWIG